MNGASHPIHRVIEPPPALDLPPDLTPEKTKLTYLLMRTDPEAGPAMEAVKQATAAIYAAQEHKAERDEDLHAIETDTKARLEELETEYAAKKEKVVAERTARIADIDAKYADIEAARAKKRTATEALFATRDFKGQAKMYQVTQDALLAAFERHF
jgi:hypothetical protein